MNKKEILKEFQKLDIKNTADLYDFLLENIEATIKDTHYNLNDSKDTMNFVDTFVTALGYKSIKFNFDKNGFNHWFLAFNDGENWLCYETILEDIIGQYSFLTYDELIFCMTNLLNSYKGNSDDKYVLKDFQNGEDIESDGVELLINDSLKLSPKYDANAKKGFSLMPGGGSGSGIKLFIRGFGLTLIICMALLGIVVYIMQNK